MTTKYVMRMPCPLVSIIIPAYNCEKYIEVCIESLIIQSYTNLEIIIIDDGSKDNTLLKCKMFEKRDSRIKVYSQKNQGVSVTRNFGMSIARGDLYAFVDGDDYVKADYIEQLVNEMPERGIVICGYTRVEEKKAKEYIVSHDLSVESLYRNIFARNDILGSCWNKLFSADVIKENKLLFCADISVGEDMLFLAEYLKCINNNFSYIPKSLYLYRKNTNSALQSSYATHKFDLKKTTCLNAIQKLNSLYDDAEVYVKKCFAYRTVRASLWLLFQMISCKTYEKKYAEIIKKNIRKNLYYYISYREGGILEILMALVAYVSPKCVYGGGVVLLKTFPGCVEKYLN